MSPHSRKLKKLLKKVKTKQRRFKEKVSIKDIETDKYQEYIELYWLN